ncbi:rubrerythrin [Carboxydocella sp. ULO1]|nr:rubrerythrin [Carboxydocella sp. ULO1]
MGEERTMDLLTALEEALQEEIEAQKKYREAAAQAADPETRLLFEQLVREEEQHEKRIRERIKAVKLLGY